MNSTQSQLQAYLDRAKFADPGMWLKRGLNPSPPSVIARMETAVNEVCAAALKEHKSGASLPQISKAMEAALKRWKAHEFDTEEREFLCSEVASIAQIVGVRMGPQLNRWLYGPILGALANLGR
jgi:Domain of unknown function (DUF4844)